jgi:hypothetical protein
MNGLGFGGGSPQAHEAFSLEAGPTLGRGSLRYSVENALAIRPVFDPELRAKRVHSRGQTEGMALLWFTPEG